MGCVNAKAFSKQHIKEPNRVIKISKNINRAIEEQEQAPEEDRKRNIDLDSSPSESSPEMNTKLINQVNKQRSLGNTNETDNNQLATLNEIQKMQSAGGSSKSLYTGQ